MFESLSQCSNWKVHKLGDFLRLNKKSQIDIDDSREYSILGVTSRGQGIVVRRIVKGFELTMKRYQVAEPNQLMWCKVDTKNGAFGLTKVPHQGALASSNMALADLDVSICLPEYLQNLFKLPVVYKTITEASLGSTNRQYLKPGDLLSSIKLQLPPLSEQRRIVGRLEHLASKIEEARGLRQQSLNVTSVLWKAIGRTVLDRIQNAKKVPLRDLINVSGGGTPSKNSSAFWNGDIPWITPKDMKKLELDGSTDYITRAALENSSAKLIEPGTVLIVVRGMILAHTVPAAVTKVPATVNQDMKALQPKANLDSRFLLTVLWALNDNLLELVESSTHGTRKLQTTPLLDFEIPLPPVTEQKQIVKGLNNFQAKVDSLKQLQAQARGELDALLPSILDKAFRGEL